MIDCLERTETDFEIIILDIDKNLMGKDLLGYSIVGDDTYLNTLSEPGLCCFVIGVGSTENNSIRRRLFQFCVKSNLQTLNIFHPSSIISTRASIGQGVVCFSNCIVNASAQIGNNVLINSGAIVEHHCVIGDHVHLATGSVLSGSVNVGQSAFIGAGATVIQNIKIGEGAIVAAGATVIEDVYPYQKVAGCPAKIINKSS